MRSQPKSPTGSSNLLIAPRIESQLQGLDNYVIEQLETILLADAQAWLATPGTRPSLRIFDPYYYYVKYTLSVRLLGLFRFTARFHVIFEADPDKREVTYLSVAIEPKLVKYCLRKYAFIPRPVFLRHEMSIPPVPSPQP